LEAHPDVDACGVIGRSDDKRGEVPVAFVELRDDSPVQPAELRAWASERLAPYQCPRDVLVVENLPRNPTGKVQRRELYALLP
jgi:long-chain acyl-CoA synthetase